MPDSAMFCAGHTGMADGRVINFGGWTGDAVVEDNMIFDPAPRPGPRRRPCTLGATTRRPRHSRMDAFLPWPVTINIGANQIECRHPGDLRPDYDTWTFLPRAETKYRGFYPMMFLMPDGRLVDTGPGGWGTKALDLDSLEVDRRSRIRTSTQLRGAAAMYRPGKILKSGHLRDDGTQSYSETWTRTSPIQHGRSRRP